MSTRIHVSGLSYFCTDDKLRQAFIPFGTVVVAQVVRDEWAILSASGSSTWVVPRT